MILRARSTPFCAVPMSLGARAPRDCEPDASVLGEMSPSNVVFANTFP